MRYWSDRLQHVAKRECILLIVEVVVVVCRIVGRIDCSRSRSR